MKARVIATVLYIAAAAGAVAEERASPGVEELMGLYNDARLLLASNRHADAAQLLENIRKHVPDNFRVNYDLACAYARLGRQADALELLGKAVDTGLVGIEHMERDSDLASLRNLTKYAEIAEKARRNAAILAERAAKTPHPKSVFMRAQGAAADEKTPLLVFLHGMGGCSSEWEATLQPITRTWKYSVLIPCGSVKLGMRQRSDSLPAYTWHGAVDIPKIVEEIKALQGIKSDEIYLAGFSAGAAMAYYTAFNNPDLFAGVIAFSGHMQRGGVPDEKLAEAAAKVPVFIVHGTQDAVASFQAGERVRDYLKAKGFSVRFKSFAGGHSLPPNRLGTLKEAVDWFKSVRGASALAGAH